MSIAAINRLITREEAKARRQLQAYEDTMAYVEILKNQLKEENADQLDLLKKTADRGGK